MPVLFDNGHLFIEENKGIVSISNAGSDSVILIYVEELEEVKKVLDKIETICYNKYRK